VNYLPAIEKYIHSLIRLKISFMPAGIKTVITEINGWKVGLSICYDLRFPRIVQAICQGKAWNLLLLLPIGLIQGLGNGKHCFAPGLLRINAMSLL
jgi:hypothetical protein